MYPRAGRSDQVGILDYREILSARENKIIQDRIDGKTYEEIGGYYEVTRERIYQQEATALRKMFKEFIRNKP